MKISIVSAFSSVKKHFKDSYKLSPFAFYCEVVEATLLISASAILTFTVLDPLYFVGSIMGVISTIIRKAAFATLLCIWFTIMNFIALIKLFG